MNQFQKSTYGTEKYVSLKRKSVSIIDSLKNKLDFEKTTTLNTELTKTLDKQKI